MLLSDHVVIYHYISLYISIIHLYSFYIIVYHDSLTITNIISYYKIEKVIATCYNTSEQLVAESDNISGRIPSSILH